MPPEPTLEQGYDPATMRTRFTLVIPDSLVAMDGEAKRRLAMWLMELAMKCLRREEDDF